MTARHPPAACRLAYPLAMGSKTAFQDSRRSTRVPLRVVLSVLNPIDRLICEAETILVNLHGGLLSTKVALSVGLRVSIHVYLTDKRANATVVYVDPENFLHCGIELEQPANIWGVPLPPENWSDADWKKRSEARNLEPKTRNL